MHACIQSEYLVAGQRARLVAEDVADLPQVLGDIEGTAPGGRVAGRVVKLQACERC